MTERTLPNFVILGAPKCGTTQLHSLLGRHPQIAMSRIKEPGFFATDRSKARLVHDISTYRALYAHQIDGQIAGEASTLYYHSDTAVTEILKHNPTTRFVIILRNPVDMAISLYRQQRLSLHEPCDTFESAWQDSPNRWASGRAPQMHANPIAVCYDRACKIGHWTQKHLELVPKTQMHVMLLDDFEADFQSTYATLLDFLDVPMDQQVSFGAADAGFVRKRPRLTRFLLSPPGILGDIKSIIKRRFGIQNSALMRKIDCALRYKVPQKLQMEPEFRAKLTDSFEIEIRQIEKIIGRDLPKWRDQSI